MPHITRSALVPYSAEQMFALVNDISAYPEFIPGCTASRVLEQNGSELTAEMNVSKAGISKSFTTRNVITENQSIVMRLVEGPFSSFAGDWRFSPLSEEASAIEFHLDFEFKNKLIEMAFGRIFKEIVSSMVMAFTRRAKEVYHA
ncbi:ubiquinone-binding protein [Sodalis-like symbiont of Philaenus spumarius]|nr:ubiquinone-binding protein [Sodalis-like symbiont of Philaenus spumarius]OZI14946.1 ubiquinone-binding protein [Sodalis-like symbiont of Philaenus spumarius]